MCIKKKDKLKKPNLEKNENKKDIESKNDKNEIKKENIEKNNTKDQVLIKKELSEINEKDEFKSDSKRENHSNMKDDMDSNIKKENKKSNIEKIKEEKNLKININDKNEPIKVIEYDANNQSINVEEINLALEEIHNLDIEIKNLALNNEFNNLLST